MYRLRFILLIFCTFFYFGRTYSMEGPWRVSQGQEQGKNSSVVFDFKRQLIDGVISPRLTIIGCRVIQFNITQDPNLNGNGNVGFLMSRLGVEREECVGDEVRDLIMRMQRIAECKIILNSMILSSASGHEIFRLTKIITNLVLASLMGNWQIVELNGRPLSISISADNSSIFLCGNNATVDYHFGGQNGIEFMIKSVRGCGENEALSQLYRARYIRQFLGTVYVYDSDSEVTMKMVRDTDRISAQGFVQQANNSQTQTLAVQPNATAVITTGTTTPPSLPFIMNPQLSEFLSTWYSSSLNLTLTTQIVRVYGDCGMWYSLINVGSIVNGRLSIHVGKASNTELSCLGKAGRIQNELNAVKALTLQSNGSKKILSMLSQNGGKIRQWSSTMQ